MKSDRDSLFSEGSISGEKVVEGAGNRSYVLLHYMCVNFRRFDIRMAHELLNHPNVETVFQHVSGEAVPVMPSSAQPSLCRVPDYAE